MSSGASDLSRLNEAERRVLRLLGEGHTAKSIAIELECTPAAINERLREARRKTGAGSSRELARLLRAQENRHQQIGVGRHRGAVALLSSSDAEAWRPHTGVSAMIALFTVAVAVAATMSIQQPTASGAKSDAPFQDPQLGAIEPDGPAWLYPMLRQEPRDPQWAANAEQRLRDRYSGITFFGMKPTLLRVTCARTVCEVAATFGAPRLDSVYTLDPALIADMKKVGLLHSGEIITGASGDPPRGIYLAYYMRAGR
jgi:DNA-binding CsgD family transcriptional regulator